MNHATAPFRIRTIVGDRPGPRLLISAGVHGDEFEPMAAVDRLARRIESSDLTGTLTLVPVVNESAFALRARCGEDGRDLARSCPGDASGTITQRVAAAITQLIEASTHFIDLHTGGIALALVPLTGYMLHVDPTVLATQRAMARAFGLPYIWGTTPTLEGRTLSAARDAGVPAIYIEHGGGSTFRSDAVGEIVDGCIDVMRLLRMLPGSLTERPTTVVEDARAGSGHLQVQNASPIDGLFESRVALGERVARGDVFGTVTSPLTGECRDVRADGDGLTFMLRVVAAVHAGDALAVFVDERAGVGS